jgi:gliding-associated putative ABC transporter substrate-binding component GldG
MATNTPAKNQRQNQAVIRLVIMAAILICVNILASYFHTGLDLTKEKRFTLSAPVKTMLRNMPEVAVIDVYLKGKFPADLQRMEEGVRERLRSFKDIAGNKIIVRFSDPLEGKNDEQKKQVVHDMAQKGMRYLELENNDEDEEEYSKKIFFPYALVQYSGREMPIMLLEDPVGRTAAEKINYSEAMLEYKFANAINQLGRPTPARIGYAIGHGEELGVKTLDMLNILPRIYALDTINLTRTLHIPLAYDAIIIYKPTIPFTGPDKLLIDQYIMHGGHVLWAINNLKGSLDSFQHSAQFIALDYGLNLDDILFKYGVRINNDLIEDRQNVPLARVVNNGPPQLHEWVYFPKFNASSNNSIVKNMDYVLGYFTNSIDTVLSAGITKTTLLESSKYSRTSNAPVRVSLSMMNYPLNNEMFNKPYRPAAILLEGKFHSVYENRLAKEYLHTLDSLHETFIPSCDSPNSMIVTSIGDVFSSDYNDKDGVLPMGYYFYTRELFANRTFLLNCLEYLTDHSGILEARSKDVKLRLLDGGRVKEEKTKWQIINVGVPIALVLVFASCYIFFRKRRYESAPDTNKTL